MAQNDIEKVKKLIPHWISHNEEHAGEYFKWADAMKRQGLEEVAEHLRLAATLINESNEHFSQAQENLKKRV